MSIDDPGIQDVSRWQAEEAEKERIRQEGGLTGLVQRILSSKASTGEMTPEERQIWNLVRAYSVRLGRFVR